MSDFKKSRKAIDSTSKTLGDTSDNQLDVLVEEIDRTEQEVDEQIHVIETKMTEIKELNQKLESASENLGQLVGIALQVVLQDIDREIKKKETEVNECKIKLESAQAEIEQQQSLINEEITKRNRELSEIDYLEQECDADFSTSKDAVNEEKETLENIQIKTANILAKIGESFNKIAASTVAVTGLASGLLDVNNRVVAPLFPDSSVFSQIKDISSKNENIAGINSDFLDLEASRDSDKERRKRESETSGKFHNQPEISG